MTHAVDAFLFNLGNIDSLTAGRRNVLKVQSVSRVKRDVPYNGTPIDFGSRSRRLLVADDGTVYLNATSNDLSSIGHSGSLGIARFANDMGGFSIDVSAADTDELLEVGRRPVKSDQGERVVVCAKTPGPVAGIGSGTIISTKRGAVAVEDLKAGDRVLTRDRGYQTIRWVGCHSADTAVLPETPEASSIRISAASLGHGLPCADLIVARGHRILVSSNIAEQIFGRRDVLIPASKLLGLSGVFADENAVTGKCYQIVFDRHEIIFASGIPCESLFTGPEVLQAISPDVRQEILSVSPELADPECLPNPAAMIPPRHLQEKLVERHCQTGTPIVFGSE